MIAQAQKKNENEIFSCSKNDTENCPTETQILQVENAKKKLREKKGTDEKNTIPPHWVRVFEFFISKSSTRTEAEKFFNYFESNGWKVGGKTAMKDWHAAARNWILNSSNFKTINKRHPEHVEGLKPNHLHTNQDKNYAEPL